MAQKKAPRKVSEMIEDEQEEIRGEEVVYQGRGGVGKFLITVVIIIIILAVAWFLLGRFTNLNLPGVGGVSGKWNAVFLSNGQVYFGKITNVNKHDLILEDIYYLQVVSVPLQSTQQGSAEQGNAKKPQQELKLIKLGNELHGPQDKMIINRDHILLTETLKSDSRVVQAINNYLANQ